MLNNTVLSESEITDGLILACQAIAISDEVDVDFDGIKDLVVAPNAKNISENESSVRFYKNNGSNSNPNFIFTSSNLFQNEMIDHGTGSIPVLFDYNQDGLKDLAIANFHRYKPILDKESTLALYKNTGTNTNPTYTYVDFNYLNLNNENYGLRIVPAFGDIDNDGDLDAIVGGMNRNQFTGIVWNDGSGNFPKHSTTSLPQHKKKWGAIPEVSAADLDNDGDLDIAYSRAGELYVGTAIQIIENLGNKKFKDHGIMSLDDAIEAINDDLEAEISRRLDEKTNLEEQLPDPITLEDTVEYREHEGKAVPVGIGARKMTELLNLELELETKIAEHKSNVEKIDQSDIPGPKKQEAIKIEEQKHAAYLEGAIKKQDKLKIYFTHKLFEEEGGNDVDDFKIYYLLLVIELDSINQNHRLISFKLLTENNSDINAENNYWGTSTESEIQASIYDYSDDFELGAVDYTPFSTALNTTAPISLPSNVTKSVSGSDVVLNWSTNEE